MWNGTFYLIETLKLEGFFLCLARSKRSLSASSACLCPAPHVGTSSPALGTFSPHLGLHHREPTANLGFLEGWGAEHPCTAHPAPDVWAGTNCKCHKSPAFHIPTGSPRCLGTSRANPSGKVVQCFPGSLSHLKQVLTCP